MFFSLRSQGLSGITVTETSTITILNQIPSEVPQVFDLSADVYLEPLKDILHTENLGPQAQELYELEVDFSSDVDKISGAVLGVECGEYMWHVQVSKKCTVLYNLQYSPPLLVADRLYHNYHYRNN